MLAEYRRAPEVTRERLYLDTMQHVMSKTSKVLVDAKGNGNLLMMPLDKLLQSGGTQSGTPEAPAAAPPPAPSAPRADNAFDPRSRDLLRDRERGER